MANQAIQILTKIQLYPERVIKHYKRSQRQVLFKQGAYIKTAMSRSMRYTTKRTKHSEPGTPPLAHKQNPLLRKLIRFAVDLSKGQVIIGPLKFGGGRSVPELLDKGGSYRPDKKLINARRYKIGQAGPIRQSSSGFVYAKLETSYQLDRAVNLALQENAIRIKNAAITIAPRPFTTPLLSDGGAKFRSLIETIK